MVFCQCVKDTIGINCVVMWYGQQGIPQHDRHHCADHSIMAVVTDKLIHVTKWGPGDIFMCLSASWLLMPWCLSTRSSVSTMLTQGPLYPTCFKVNDYLWGEYPWDIKFNLKTKLVGCLRINWIVCTLIVFCSPCLSSALLKTESRQDANFAIADSTRGCSITTTSSATSDDNIVLMTTLHFAGGSGHWVCQVNGLIESGNQ